MKKAFFWLLLVPATLHAQTLIDQKLDTLFEVMNLSRIIEPQVQALREEVLSAGSLYGEDDFNKYLSDTYENVVPGIIENLYRMYVNVYKENYSVEEVDSLIDFYRSPAGSKTLAVQGLLVQETANYRQLIAGRFQEQVKPLHEEYEQNYLKGQYDNNFSDSCAGKINGTFIGGGYLGGHYHTIQGKTWMVENGGYLYTYDLKWLNTSEFTLVLKSSNNPVVKPVDCPPLSVRVLACNEYGFEIVFHYKGEEKLYNTFFEKENKYKFDESKKGSTPADLLPYSPH